MATRVNCTCGNSHEMEILYLKDVHGMAESVMRDLLKEVTPVRGVRGGVFYFLRKEVPLTGGRHSVECADYLGFHRQQSEGDVGWFFMRILKTRHEGHFPYPCDNSSIQCPWETKET